MTTNCKSLRSRVGLLIGAHIALGLAMAIPSLAYPGRNWPGWVQVWFFGLACSEILLVGIWVGFSASAWWLRLAGLSAGTGWLAFLGLSTDLRAQNVLPMLGFLGTPMLVVAGACLVCRFGFVRLERQDSWQPLSQSDEVQFSLKSIFGLTLLVSLLLALGRLVQRIDQGISSATISVCVFVLVALLTTWMLVWASLSRGRVQIRLPLAIAGTLASGLIFPYYLGGPGWRYVIWPSLMLVIALFTTGSLLVVRSSGFRLVPIRRPPMNRATEVITVERSE